MSRIDDILSDQEEQENSKHKVASQSSGEIEYLMGDNGERPIKETSDEEKVLIGKVDRFFSKINVAAIELQGDLKVGDTIQIENDEEKIRLVVSSMQINKVDVEAATEGDDVGIKVDVLVKEGSTVYRIG